MKINGPIRSYRNTEITKDLTETAKIKKEVIKDQRDNFRKMKLENSTSKGVGSKIAESSKGLNVDEFA